MKIDVKNWDNKVDGSVDRVDTTIDIYLFCNMATIAGGHDIFNP